MNQPSIVLYILVMAGVTYLIRMIPLAAIQKKITNRFLLSFLYYTPYGVLSAMTFPAVFSATGSLFTACAGVAAALILALWKGNLLVVAAISCAVVFAAQFLEPLIF